MKKNLSKLELVRHTTKLYIAAPTIIKFTKIKKSIRNKHVKEVVYWPTLAREEGYWISPFSHRKGLKRVFKELQNKKTPVMLDLELPTTQNPLLYLTQFVQFIPNKQLIKSFIKTYQGNIYLAEYYPEGKRQERWLQFLGLHYTNPKCKIIKMVYHSLHHFDEEFIVRELKRGRKEYGKNFLVAYGIIAKGIHENNSTLSPEQLQKDISIAKKAGVSEIIIFRLGGLNREYQRVLYYSK